MNEITILSFGYLYGLPERADTVIGARGLPNPYYVEALKHSSGLDPAVRDYVFSTPEAKEYFACCLDLVRRRIALYAGYDSPLKEPLVIAVGCSGGKHRSVSMVHRLAEALEAEGTSVRVDHRDINKRLEHSAGAVVFTRREGELRYVIEESLSGYPGFPKGHMEAGEKERETALREVFEEVGLRPRLLPDFRAAEVYPLPGKPDTYKQVVYFLAEYRDQTPVPQDTEVRAIRLLPFEEALAALRRESARQILRDADAFLKHR